MAKKKAAPKKAAPKKAVKKAAVKNGSANSRKGNNSAKKAEDSGHNAHSLVSGDQMNQD